MNYLRTAAGPDGESHFADLEATLLPVEFVPGRPLMELSTALPTAASALARLPAGWEGAYHPSPRRQLVIPLAGEMEVTTSDGEVRRIGLGTLWLLEDTTGTGHLTRVSAAAEWRGGGWCGWPRRQRHRCVEDWTCHRYPTAGPSMPQSESSSTPDTDSSHTRCS